MNNRKRVIITNHEPTILLTKAEDSDLRQAIAMNSDQNMRNGDLIIINKNHHLKKSIPNMGLLKVQ